MGHIKCLSLDFCFDIIIAHTWDGSALHLSVRKGKKEGGREFPWLKPCY